MSIMKYGTSCSRRGFTQGNRAEEGPWRHMRLTEKKKLILIPVIKVSQFNEKDHARLLKGTTAKLATVRSHRGEKRSTRYTGATKGSELSHRQEKLGYARL